VLLWRSGSRDGPWLGCRRLPPHLIPPPLRKTNETSIRGRLSIACLLLADECADLPGHQLYELSDIGASANDSRVLVIDGLAAKWARIIAFLDPVFDASGVEEVLLVAVQPCHVLAIPE